MNAETFAGEELSLFTIDVEERASFGSRDGDGLGSAKPSELDGDATPLSTESGRPEFLLIGLPKSLIRVASSPRKAPALLLMLVLLVTVKVEAPPSLDDTPSAFGRAAHSLPI